MHKYLVLFVELNFLLKIFCHIFAVVNHNKEIFPKMKIVLLQVEYLLITRIPLVFLLKKSNKLRWIVIHIVDVLLDTPPLRQIVSNFKLFLILYYPVAVVSKIDLLLTHERFQIVWIYPRCIVELYVQVLPFCCVLAELLVELMNCFLVWNWHDWAKICWKTWVFWHWGLFW